MSVSLQDMKYGLTEKEFSLLKEKIISPLKQHQARVFLFGSRATGKQKPFSDVDILYIQNPNHPIPGHVIYTLLTDMEESRFPYKVDLVNFEELAKSYKETVDQEKIEI